MIAVSYHTNFTPIGVTVTRYLSPNKKLLISLGGT